MKIVLAFFLLGSFLYYLNLLKPHVYHVVESDKVELQGWQQFKTAEELKNHLEAAKSKGQPVILDFYADWCAACHQLKKETFSQPDFQKATQDYLLLQYDATNSTEFLDQLRKDYSIVGLPTVVIFNRQGGVEKDRTVTEFISSEEFIKRLQGL